MDKFCEEELRRGGAVDPAVDELAAGVDEVFGAVDVVCTTVDVVVDVEGGPFGQSSAIIEWAQLNKSSLKVKQIISIS